MRNIISTLNRFMLALSLGTPSLALAQAETTGKINDTAGTKTEMKLPDQQKELATARKVGWSLAGGGLAVAGLGIGLSLQRSCRDGECKFSNLGAGISLSAMGLGLMAFGFKNLTRGYSMDKNENSEAAQMSTPAYDFGIAMNGTTPTGVFAFEF
jgi:hypothetical protein